MYGYPYGTDTYMGIAVVFYLGTFEQGPAGRAQNNNWVSGYAYRINGGGMLPGVTIWYQFTGYGY